MHSIPAKQARLDFTHLVDEVAFHGERYIVTRNGRELVAMVPMSDLAVLQDLEKKRDIEIAKKVEEHIAEYGTESWDEIEKRLGIE
jgi:prevent-host-death family protein